MPPFTVIKRDAQGQPQLQYRGKLHARGRSFVCIDATFAPESRDLGYISLQQGDLFREWFYHQRWYNIFRVHDPESRAIKGWYCNITRPPQIAPLQVAADDLALDLFVYPDGRLLRLDEQEFAALQLPLPERHQALQAAIAIERMVMQGAPPFGALSRPTPNRGG